MRGIYIASCVLAVMLVTETVLAATPAVQPAKSRTWVLIVGGINKDVEERQAKDRSVLKLRKAMLDHFHIPAEQLVALVDTNSFVSKPSGVSTVEGLGKTLQTLAPKITRNDVFIFYYIGQANVVAGTLRVNLPGPDITHGELAQRLAALKPAKMIVVLDCPAAGLAVKSLAAPSRIVLAAARSDQPYSTRFSEFFVPALTDSQGDTDHDGHTSFLEAFQQVARQIDEFYSERKQLKTETPLLEDDGDGVPSQQPWLYKENKKDGALAAEVFLSTGKVKGKKP